MGRRVRELPSVVEAPLGVAEYWYEVFRRVVVIPLPGGCYMLSIDVYRPDWPFGEPDEVVELGEAALLYKHLGDGVVEGVSGLTVVGLRVRHGGGERYETISARGRVCGGRPSYEDVWAIYRRVVGLVEGRDPEKTPLAAVPTGER